MWDLVYDRLLFTSKLLVQNNEVKKLFRSILVDPRRDLFSLVISLVIGSSFIMAAIEWYFVVFEIISQPLSLLKDLMNRTREVLWIYQQLRFQISAKLWIFAFKITECYRRTNYNVISGVIFFKHLCFGYVLFLDVMELLSLIVEEHVLYPGSGGCRVTYQSFLFFAGNEIYCASRCLHCRIVVI